MKNSKIERIKSFHSFIILLIILSGCNSSINSLIGKWEKIETIYVSGDKMDDFGNTMISEFTDEGINYIYRNDTLVEEATSSYKINKDTVSITLEFDLGFKKISNTEKIYYEIRNDTLMFKLTDGQISYYKKLK